MTTRIYLDHTNGAPLLPSVVDVMRQVARLPGNPSSLHAQGRLARLYREEAAARVRALVGGTPADVMFTGSGDEANWLGILGLARAQRSERGATRIVVRDDMSACVESAVAALMADGFTRADEINAETAIVVTAIDGASSGVVLAAERCDVPVHVDATRAIGRVALNLVQSGATTMALASEPIGGPRGVGCVVALKGTQLTPLWQGGGQENGARSGSQAVMLIAGFGEAVRYSGQQNLSDENGNLANGASGPREAGGAAASEGAGGSGDAGSPNGSRDVWAMLGLAPPLDVIWAGLGLRAVAGERLRNVSCVHTPYADALIAAASAQGVMLGRTPRGVRAQGALDFGAEELRIACKALARCVPDLQKAGAHL